MCDVNEMLIDLRFLHFVCSNSSRIFVWVLVFNFQVPRVCSECAKETTLYIVEVQKKKPWLKLMWKRIKTELRSFSLIFYSCWSCQETKHIPYVFSIRFMDCRNFCWMQELRNVRNLLVLPWILKFSFIC